MLKKYKVGKKYKSSIFVLIFIFDIYGRKYVEISIKKNYIRHSSMSDFRIITMLHKFKNKVVAMMKTSLLF